ncbi:peptidyl-tRNA hydrolase 2, mitochondrial [Leptinotarsa decemlineata]|uniref:peptidyl-tRNA hydrolase 2, mitochondrial n=1 Tax=Leptinotarsa decemlineata TaxID=7539 RepID=UPI000C252302|nr:peptidyl-tRNA hydrolase 2, mitochondrial-like [Leptinotarsa decemlineata]
MGLVTSNSYFVFSMGTFIGAATTYFITRLKHKPKEEIWINGMDDKYEFKVPTDEYRLIIGVRNDLKMQKGKVAAQCGHAAVAAYVKCLKQNPKVVKNWMRFGGTKIALRIDSEEEMMALDKCAKEFGVLSSVIRDAGQTQVAPGTRTVIAIGPAPKSVLEKITGHLKLY